MSDDIEWVMSVVLDELDAHLDRRDCKRGKAPTEHARAVGREAMRASIESKIRANLEAAASLRAMGPDAVRAAVRRMIEPSHVPGAKPS